MTVTRMDERNQSRIGEITGQRGATCSPYAPVSGTSTNASQCDAQYGQEMRYPCQVLIPPQALRSGSKIFSRAMVWERPMVTAETRRILTNGTSAAGCM